MRPKSDFAALATPAVREIQPYVPGKPMTELAREYGISDVIKLASNENPLGPPEECHAAMLACLSDQSRYPDGAAFELKRGLSVHLGVAPEQITVGNGSNEILSIIAETFLGAGDEAICSEFAFAIYGLVVQATGASARVARANSPAGGQPLGHSLEEFGALVNGRTRLVFIANPNNPTGTWLAPSDLRAFVADLPGHVLAVIDEAYLEYMPAADSPDTLSWLAACPNVIVCRTFSKMYALAGMRVGYAVSHPDVAALLDRVRQPFNVNGLGQVAALAALGADQHVRRSRRANDEGMAQLRAGLADFGWSVPPSAGNFVLADTGGPAGPWYDGLLRAGVIVRPVANYGLPRHLRITVGLPGENDRLLRALRDLRQAGLDP